MLTIILPDGYKIQAEVAATDAARQRGLAGRQNLPEDHGMLFVWPDSDKPAMRQMCMKGMLFDLDILWIDRVAPGLCRVRLSLPLINCGGVWQEWSHQFPACYVLELPSGQALRHEVMRGSILRF